MSEKTENIGISFLNETMLVHGTNDDLTCLSKFIVYSKERQFGSIKGGSLMTIINLDINHSRWEPRLVMFPYLDAERSWVLVHEGGRNVAICLVYIAAEAPNSNFGTWNFELYAMITAEMSTISNEGYECLIIGDLNGHIGCDVKGIPGNNTDINLNGTLVRDFIYMSTGRMTLIDKKQPSQLVSGKRPLTVLSVILNIFTKIVHKCMDKVCEEEGYYGPLQSGRSTTDCVFILLAAIRKAKKHNHTISIAFCDNAKAYDSVNQELLYTKLDSIGFGGRVKALIQAMYYNDKYMSGLEKVCRLRCGL